MVVYYHLYLILCSDLSHKFIKLIVNLIEIKERFGKTLKVIRKNKGMTLSTLAVKCQLDDSQISKIEKGVWDIQLSTIFILAKGLDVDAKELLDFNKYTD